MKKILALVLALTMVLGIASAVAESPTNGGKQNATPFIVVDEKLPELKFVTATGALLDMINAFQAAHNNGDALAAFPDDFKAKIPAEYTQINEAVALQFEGNTNITKDAVYNIKFETPYAPEGESVIVAIGKLDGDQFTWTDCKGVIKADGSVDVTIPASLVKAIGNNPFLAVVVSK